MGSRGVVGDVGPVGSLGVGVGVGLVCANTEAVSVPTIKHVANIFFTVKLLEREMDDWPNRLVHLTCRCRAA